MYEFEYFESIAVLCTLRRFQITTILHSKSQLLQRTESKSNICQKFPILDNLNTSKIEFSSPHLQYFVPHNLNLENMYKDMQHIIPHA